MLCIVLVAAYLPEVCFHGLLAAGGVLLCDERSLIGSNLTQVTRTGADSCLYFDEAVASCDLISAQRSTTFVAVSSGEVDTLAIGAGRRGYSVGSYEVGTVGVLTFLDRFGQRTGYGLKQWTRCKFCHSRVFFMVSLLFRAFFSVLRFLGLFVLSDGLEDEVDKDSEELEDGL